MNRLQIDRQSDRPTRRREGRRPLLENLEGRQLLSGIAGNALGGLSATTAQVQPIGPTGPHPAILFPVFAQ